MDERPEPATAVVPPLFEGEPVTDIEGKLPAIVMAMEEGYARGTILRFQVEVHVRYVNHPETKGGGLVRQHVFGLDSVELVAAYRPEQALDQVGGSASARPSQSIDGQGELGLAIGRTGELWGRAS